MHVFGKAPCLGCKTSVLNTRAKLERRPLRLRTGLSVSLLAHGIAARVEGLAGNNVSKYYRAMMTPVPSCIDPSPSATQM